MTDIAIPLARGDEVRPGLVCDYRRNSSAQMFIVCRLSAVFSLTPRRKSMAWNRQPCCWQRSRTFGKTCSCRWSRSAFRSLKVELTKTRKVRDVDVTAEEIQGSLQDVGLVAHAHSLLQIGA